MRRHSEAEPAGVWACTSSRSPHDKDLAPTCGAVGAWGLEDKAMREEARLLGMCFKGGGGSWDPSPSPFLVPQPSG